MCAFGEQKTNEQENRKRQYVLLYTLLTWDPRNTLIVRRTVHIPICACVGDATYHPYDGSHHDLRRTLFPNRFVFKF